MNLSNPLTSRKKGFALSILTFLAAICILILIPTISVKADAGFGPPFMHFFLEYEISPVPIVKGNVFGCSDAKCSTVHDLGFGCGSFSCTPDKYSGWEKYKYYKLVITFDDKTRESDIFTRNAGFFTDRQFFVKVKDNSLFVRESSYPFYPKLSPLGFCIALPLTLIIELVVAAIFIKATRKTKRILAWVLLGNIITLPVVWFIIPQLNLDYVYLITLAELFAVTFEALFLYFTNETRLSFKQAAMLSLLMNGLSFIAGELLNRFILHLWNV